MRTEVLSVSDPAAMARALQVLQGGGLVAFPTDTVYGVGSLAFAGTAVAKIYEAKGRSGQRAIPVLVGSLDDLARVAAELTPNLQLLAERFWPGALTLVVPKHPALPPEVSPDVTVGVRMPDHPLAAALLSAAGPMAVSSANRSGSLSVTAAAAVLSELGGRIELILDGGEAPGGQPSTVVDCTHSPPVLLRQGPIPLGAVLDCLGLA